MRKFTKGLFLTLVASAMSVGASAQINGYFRVVNVGYALNEEKGVMHVTAPTTAQPTATPEEALTLPGTVMYIDATPMSDNPETDAQYVDYINDNDLIVNSLRSQAVDASAAVYGPMVAQMKAAFLLGVQGNNGKLGWGLEEDAITTIVDEMFYYMQMFLEPTTYEKDGMTIDTPTYYLKSTTPNVKPLVDALAEKGIEINEDDLWTLMWKETMQYYQDNKMDQAALEWNYFVNRIHLGHTYYLIGGRVIPDFAAGTQTFEPLPNGQIQVSFANANKYYGGDMVPEIEKADLYALWVLAPVTTEAADDEEFVNYFAVKNGVPGNDGHYYATGYFDFPFKPTEGVRVWGIQEVYAPQEWVTANPANTPAAYVKPFEYTGTVPAHTPVVIENTKASNPVAILQPVDQPADAGDASVMKGIFFDATFDATSESGAADTDGFDYYELPLDKEPTKTIYRENVRVFNRGLNTLNPLGFFKYKNTKDGIKANKGFIDMTDIVPAEAAESANVIILDAESFADGITEVANAENNSNVVYDIQGRIVKNMTKGLYIVNGKKVVK